MLTIILTIASVGIFDMFWGTIGLAAVPKDDPRGPQTFGAFIFHGYCLIILSAGMAVGWVLYDVIINKIGPLL